VAERTIHIICANLKIYILNEKFDSVCNSYCGLDLFDANKMCKKIGIGNAKNKLVDIKYF
jgi:hypothetical protein